jgi:hypothetical protein
MEFDIKTFEELVNQIKEEHPKLDIEMAKYVAGSYLFNDLDKDKTVVETTADIL